MQTTPTPLAAEIFGNVQALDRTAVFLAVQDQGPVLSAGLNRTQRVTYQAFLRSADVEVSLPDIAQFALLMDGRGPGGSPRLVLYCEDDPEPVLQYNQGCANYPDLTGQIFITAQEPRGEGIVTIHAVFNGNNGASLLIDSSPVLQRHLRQCVRLVEKGV